jgi:hypothetical protein
LVSGTDGFANPKPPEPFDPRCIVRSFAMSKDTSTMGRTRKLIPSGIYVGSQSDTRAQLRLLSEDQLGELNYKMNARAKQMQWSSILKNAESLSPILEQALVYASTALQSTSLKDHIIAPKSVRNQAPMEDELSSDEKAKWMTLLKKALKTGDWEELIAHRLFHHLLFSFFNMNSSPSSDLASGFVITIGTSPSSAKIVECRGST